MLSSREWSLKCRMVEITRQAERPLIGSVQKSSLGSLITTDWRSIREKPVHPSVRKRVTSCSSNHSNSGASKYVAISQTISGFHSSCIQAKKMAWEHGDE